MVTIDWVLLLVAFLCFVAAMFGLTSRVNLVATGLALLVLTMLTP
jgi:hypothetical protein